MSKEGSEVAFIPDNISNISSGKEKNNEDTSQKIEDSYISKLTKLHNHQNPDVETGLEIADIKACSPNKYKLREDADPKQIVEVITKKLASDNINVEYVVPNIQKQVQKRFSFHKFVKEPVDLPLSHTQGKRYSHHESDYTYLQGKHTETDVISEKESFVEEEHEVSIQKNLKSSHQNVLFDNIVHYDSVEQSEKPSKRKLSVGPKGKEYLEDLKETFYVTEVNKYDEFQTQLGWLQHCTEGNIKHLLRQTNQLLDYNRAVMMEIEKVQLRTKIIELEIETNKLKIALRKSPSSKHINFSVDLKFNRPTLLKIPKKVDLSKRKYCAELQNTLSDLKKLNDSNQKQLASLEFYQKQFEKKVNFAYIYQEYLIEKAKKQLNIKSPISSSSQLRNSPVKDKNSEDSLHFTLSPNKKQEVFLREASKNMKTTAKNLNLTPQKTIDQSSTSLAKNLKSGNKNSLRKNFTKMGKNSQDSFQGPQNNLIRNSKPTEYFIKQTNSEYYTEALPKSPKNNRKNDSVNKKIALTHHKDITLPLSQKFIGLSNGQTDESFLPLFNTPNREKKHFFYECQIYLKQLENDYLCQCESEKRNLLVTNQNGFRQRELLKMKTHQLKNSILDTEVDIVTKQKELTKQNSILKKELEILENQLFIKFNGDYGLENQKKMKKTIRSPAKLQKILPQDYEILYKQAEHRLKSYKSAAMLQNIKPNIPKSPKKIVSKQSMESVTSLEKLHFANDIKSEENDKKLSKPEVVTVKQSRHQEGRKPSKSPVLFRLKSSSKSSKFLKRFKTNLTEDFLNMTIKEDSPTNSERKKANPETTVTTESPNKINMSIPQVEFIQEQYYAI